MFKLCCWPRALPSALPLAARAASSAALPLPATPLAAALDAPPSALPWDIRQELGEADRVVMLSRPLDLSAISLRPQRQASDKPAGLWYSLGPAWLDFCREVLPAFERELHYRLTLDRSRLLVVANDAELNAFIAQYRVGSGPADEPIDWCRVAASGYAGIELPQYLGMQDGRRVTFAYTWDVPSGVVWDASAILDTQLIPRQAPFVPFVAKPDE